MFRQLILLTTCLLISLSGLKAQQTINATLDVSGVSRQYIVYIPDSYDATAATPLMFNFHGFTQQASNHMFTSAMRQVADTAGFILVYPQGSGFFGVPHWNVGAWTVGSTANDIGFTEAMIDTLSAGYNIDLNRVYSCGYSNGGYFSFELACKLSDRIAAIGSVGGKMSSQTFNECSPTHAMPVITIHGTSDDVVSYSTSAPSNSKTIPETNNFWIAYNNLDTSPTVLDLPDTDMSDGSTVEFSTYENECVSLEHYKVNGGGHDWVGVRGNMDIDASSVIWNFVSKYDLNGLIDCSNPITNTSEAFAKTLALYPNPTQGFVTVDVELTETVDCRIYSLTGQQVFTRKIGPNNTSLDVSSLAKGVYVLVAGEQRVKLVKG